MSGENTKITLDSPEFLEKKQRLSSPRSIEACRLIGITPNELYPITLDEYINKHPDIKYIKQNLQEQRFNNFDKIRKENLEAAQSKRKEIIENEGNKSNQSKSQNKMNNSTAVKIQQEKAEKMKQKQINNLKLKIDYEYKMATLRKQNE